MKASYDSQEKYMQYNNKIWIDFHYLGIKIKFTSKTETPVVHVAHFFLYHTQEGPLFLSGPTLLVYGFCSRWIIGTAENGSHQVRHLVKSVKNNSRPAPL
jgi:hypothetical protein